MAGVELGAAFISVGLSTGGLSKEISQVFGEASSKAESSGNGVGKSFSSGVASALKSAMLPALATGGGLLAFGQNVGALAAEAEQNMGAVGSVFKSASGDVATFAADSATKLGISSSEYNSFASLIGSQFKNAGVPMDQLAGKTNDLVTKGADLSSMFGGTTSDAVSALSSALKGEMDPIEKYGISLNDASIKGKMAEMGLSGLTGEAEKAARTQAILALVNQQSADATGNFAKESGTAAGAQQIANAKWEDARATLGEALLPAMTAISSTLSGMAGWIKENSGLVTGLAIGVGGLAAAVVIANAAASTFAAVSAIVRGATMAWTGIQWALNAAMTANPLGIVVVAIAALVAAVVLAYNNVGWFKDGVDAAFKWVSEAAGAMAKWIGEALGNIGKFFTDTWNNVTGFLRDTWNNIVSLVQGSISNVGGFISSGLNMWFGLVSSILGNIGGFFSDTWNNVINGVAGFISGFLKFFNDLPGNIMTALAGAGKWLFDVGKNIVQGLIDGVKGMIDGAVNAVKDVGGAMLDGVKGFLGIHSPSRVFKTQVGMMIGAGLIEGIDASHTGVTSAVNGLVAIPQVPAYGAGSFTPAGAGAQRVSASNVFNITQVDDPIGTAHATARRFQAMGV
ncbi:hypothetical protein [Arthrobacter sp. CJ23]|uniref:phage tail protein n=1 Tax=Arthrobacter sp. CJ23 TaxID=2972479 RepID=UPI00215CAF9B|nr:hypothetical protein [Arthrobacter sp. CJ23]UVJ40241.1 hypothetical protein NVV90_03375 [Arthrobacter sp. CJ23]